MIGPDFDHLLRDCTPILTNSNNPLPSEYDDAEWIAGTYTPDGQQVYALVHSEYHGFAHPGYCGDEFVECRYNTVTSAVSTNGGNSTRSRRRPDTWSRRCPTGPCPATGATASSPRATSSRKTASSTT